MNESKNVEIVNSVLASGQAVPFYCSELHIYKLSKYNKIVKNIDSVYMNDSATVCTNSWLGAKIIKKKMTLTRLESEQLLITGTSQKVTWSSSDKKVATVDKTFGWL